MATQRDSIEQRLRKRAEDLEATRDSGHEDVFGTDQREATGELSAADQHPGDVADFTFHRELQLSTERILDQEADQAREAMRALDEGRYGQCQSCGGQISAARLEARPEATLCIDCQRSQEGAG